MTRICYAKLGRSVLLDPKKWGPVGGDNEPLALLLNLAGRHPDVEFVVAGRHSGDPGNLPANIIVPPLGPEEDRPTAIQALYDGADGVVLWLGQHGTSNQPIRKTKSEGPDDVTNPQEWSRNYCGPIIKGLNAWQDADPSRDPVWLCADPRNYLKMRDLKWPPFFPILAQYDLVKKQRHWRFYDERTPEFCGRPGVMEEDGWHWTAPQTYAYSGLELVGVPRGLEFDPDFQIPFADRVPFGVVINEARSYVALDRATITRDWIRPLNPDFIHGKWSKDGLVTAGFEEIEPVHYTKLFDTMATARTTFTTPTSGSGWATAKWWEAAALGVVCFIHPKWDEQGHVIPRQVTGDPILDGLHQWLHADSPADLATKVAAASQDEAIYTWLRDAQYEVLRRAREKQQCVTMIEQRLGLQ